MPTSDDRESAEVRRARSEFWMTLIKAEPESCRKFGLAMSFLQEVAASLDPDRLALLTAQVDALTERLRGSR